MDIEANVVNSAPGICLIGAAGMVVLAAKSWGSLGNSDRLALGLDGAAYALAVRPLRSRQMLGWRILFAATAIQPAFAFWDVLDKPDALGRSLGRTLGTGAVLAGLQRLKPHYS